MDKGRNVAKSEDHYPLCGHLKKPSVGFEPTTPSLQNWCSAAELRGHFYSMETNGDEHHCFLEQERHLFVCRNIFLDTVFLFEVSHQCGSLKA